MVIFAVAQTGLSVEHAHGERVHDDHDEQGDEKRERRPVDHEVLVAQHALPILQDVARIEHAQDGDGAGDSDGDRPHQDDLEEDHALGLVLRPQRVADADVALQRDGAQVQDGRRAHQHVRGHEQVAERQPEQPLA